MATTSREVQLKVTAIAEGGSAITDLAKDVDALTKEGEQASPVFTELAAELQKLAEQQALVTELNKIRETTAATAAELDIARAKVTALGETLQSQTASSAEFTAQQTNLKEAISQTAIEIKQTEGALKTLRESNDSAAKGTQEYKDQVITLNGVLTNLKVQQIEQKAQLEQVDTASRDATKSVKTLTSEYNVLERSTSVLSDKLKVQNEVLNTTEAELKATGLATENLATSQAAITAGVTAVNDAYLKEVASLKAVEAAQKQALVTREAQIAADERFLAAQSAEVAALGRVEQAAREAAAAQKAYAASVQETLNNAFGATGVRSLEQINAEALKVQQALNHVATEFQQGGISAQSFTRAVEGAKVQLAALQTEANTLPTLPGVFERISASVSNAINRFAGLGAAIATVSLAVKPVFDLAIQVDALQRALKTITGTSQEANSQLEFLRKTADFSGLSFTKTADSFVRFTASMRTAGISAADTQKVFFATANAAGNLGLSSDKTTHILDALGQMASKGVVSMEELRQQLGESLPGALGLMAKGLGITQSQLVKLVESGKLLTQDALVPLANAMVELGSKGKQVEGLGASFARLSNAISKALQSATDSGAFKSLASIIDFTAKNFQTLVNVTYDFGKAMLALKLASTVASFLGLGNAAKTVTLEVSAATVATEANSIATSANTAATTTNTAVKRSAAAANTALATSTAAATTSTGLLSRAAAGLGSAFGPVGTIALLVAVNIRDLGKAIGEGIGNLQGYGRENAKFEATMKANAEAVRLNAEENAKLSPSIVKAGVAYAEAEKAVEANVKASARLVEARKIEGDSMIRIAELSGSEVNRLLAESKAAEDNAAATKRSAEAKQQESDLLTVYIDQINKSVVAKGASTDADRKLLKDSQQKLEVLNAEVEALKQAAAADEQRAVAANATAAAYADNTSRLNELKEASQNAQTALAIMAAAAASGAVSQEALAKASQNAAVAQKLYRDAISDSVVEAGRMKDGAAFLNQVLGESKISLEGSAKAATNYAEKLSETTTMLRNEVDILKESLKAQLEYIAAHGDPTGKLAKEVNEIGKLITAKEQEIEASRRTTAAAKDDAAAKEIAAAAYKDNSASIGQYASQLKIAQEELRKITQLHKEGKATTEDVIDATRRVATATALYKDALHDATTAIQNRIQLDKALAGQMDATNKLALEQAKTSEAVAKAKGDERAVTESLIKQKEIERNGRAQNADAMRAEADNDIALANAYKDELDKTGQLTPEKENEIKIRIANAEAKKTEAAATAETVKQINAEIEAMKRQASQKQINNRFDKEGYEINTEGKRVEAADQRDPKTPPTRRSDGQWNYTGSDGEWHISQREPIVGKGGAWIDPDGNSGFATNPDAGTTSATGGKGQIGAGGGSTGGGFSTTHVVNVNLGGTTTAVNTASAADSQNLVDLMKQLSTDKSRS